MTCSLRRVITGVPPLHVASDSGVSLASFQAWVTGGHSKHSLLASCIMQRPNSTHSTSGDSCWDRRLTPLLRSWVKRFLDTAQLNGPPTFPPPSSTPAIGPPPVPPAPSSSALPSSLLLSRAHSCQYFYLGHAPASIHTHTQMCICICAYIEIGICTGVDGDKALSSSDETGASHEATPSSLEQTQAHRTVQEALISLNHSLI